MVSTHIEKLLQDTPVDREQFGDLLIYLMTYGAINRPEKGTYSEKDTAIETELYDRYVLVKDLVADVFSLFGIGIAHNEHFKSVRLYAPDADFPGSNEVKDKGSNLMRMPISKDLAAALIVCYQLYEQHRMDGTLEDDFTAVVSQIEFMSGFTTLLGIEYDATRTKGVKDDVYRSLKRMRAVNYHANFLTSADYPLIIRPQIYEIVPEDIAKDTIAAQEASKGEDDED